MRAQMSTHHALGPDRWLCPNAPMIALLPILNHALGGRELAPYNRYAPRWNPESDIMRLMAVQHLRRQPDDVRSRYAYLLASV